MIDFVVAAVAALCDLLVFARPAGPGHTGLLGALLLAAVVFLAIGLRRRGPVVAYGALIIMAVVVAGAAPGTSALIFLAAAYVLYLVTTTTNKQTGAAAMAVGLGAIGLLTVADQNFRQGGEGVFVPVAFALVIAWITGYSVRQRRLYADALQYQAASSAVAEERLRIARELHDVVAHSMSVIAVQAGYGQYVIDSSPDDARDALGAIQATSRDALEEMRRMLGVLRQQDVAPGPGAASRAPLAPAPGLSDLDRLIQRTRGAGVHVDLEYFGLVRAVPAGVDLSAYRIVQEALTNVVRHAGGGARCRVSLRYGQTAMHIRVTDDGGRSQVLTPAAGSAPSGAGHGIIGMRERANLCGGEFTAGPLPDGGFQVTATLPLLTGPAGAGPADYHGDADAAPAGAAAADAPAGAGLVSAGAAGRGAAGGGTA